MMIAPRPRTAADVAAPTPATLLALRAEELSMGNHHTAVHALSAHYQNEIADGDVDVCDDQDSCGDRPPKYTRHSHSVHPHSTYTPTHTSQPSTSSSSSSSSSSTAAHSMSSATTATARPSLDSLNKREPESADAHTHPAQPPHSHGRTSSEDIPAPPYTSAPSSSLPNTHTDLTRTSLTALQNTSFPALDALDAVDDRADPDAIVQRRLTRNALLARQSALTFVSSVWSADEPPPLPPTNQDEGREQRESTYTTYSYSSSFDPTRASVQTYGSSVLTYGSPTHQQFPSTSTSDERERPVAPLPWLPRPSALSRIHSQSQGGRARSGSMGSTSSASSGTNGGGRRPLPPLPTPTSTTRDRSVSLPAPPPSSPSSRSSYSQASNSPSISTYSILNVGVRRPRPLPRTPSMLSTASGAGLPDIAEGEVVSAGAGAEPSWGPVRTERSSMFLSPTDGPAGMNFGNIGMKGRRGASARYSTIGYGHVARASVRNAFLFGDDGNGNEDGRGVPERKENASRASTRSTYFVPDVDELVRILDSMDDGSGSGESVPPTPIAGARPGPANEDGDKELDMAAALKLARSTIALPRGEKLRVGTAMREDLNKQANIGLLTPAATPRSSPHRLPETLPSHSQSRSQSARKHKTEAESEVSSPAPTSAGALSLTSFPLPPLAPLYIPAPGALGAADMPIPTGSAISFASLIGEEGKSHAERAMLSWMDAAQRHTSTRDAIKDLRERVSGLPDATGTSSPPKKAHAQGMKKFSAGVPLISLPIPPRRRTQSSSTTAISQHQPQHPTSAARKPPAIDIRAANALPPPSAFGTSAGLGKSGGLISCGATSAPAHGLVFGEENQRPTIIYSTPAPAPARSVAPLRIKRASGMSQMSKKGSQRLGQGQTLMVHVPPPPPAAVPQSASAAQTSFDVIGSPPSAGRAQRAASVCVSPGSGSVAPLRFRNSKIGGGLRARSSTIGQASMGVQVQAPPLLMKMTERPMSEVDASEESESDQLTTPTSCEAPETPLAGVVEPEEGCGTGLSSLSAIERANGAIDPVFADIIKSIAGGSEEEQMGSLLTLASSINTEHHASGYNAGFSLTFLGDEEGEGEFVDVEEGEEEEEVGRREVRRSVASSEKRRSKTKKRQSTRSAAAVRAAIRALPDPSTFPIPDSGGSVATDSSAAAAGSDYANFLRPSPLPKLKLVTKFKGGSVLLPASQAPMSAASTKSGMSSMSSYGAGGGSHSRRASGVSVVKRSSTVAGPRKLNRLTLTDPRSPMADAAIAAAALVARVRQKRAALAQRGIGPNGIPLREGAGGGHRRTNSGSSGTLRSKLKMSGGGFFGGSSVRAIASPAAVATSTVDDDATKAITSTVAADGVLRSGPRAQRPTIRRARMNRTSVALSHNGDLAMVGKLDLCA